MREERVNLKSDVNAKQAFANLLFKKGYIDIKIVSSPADIIAIKEGLKYYFEIKFTNKLNTYFGAATLTEWTAAMNNPNNFKFVIAHKQSNSWKFIEYTPLEFMKFNTIPPFKTYFNISLDKRHSKKHGKLGKSIKLTEENLNKMSNLWNSFVKN